MTDCYKQIPITYARGLFDDFVDVTYVITMKNSPRRTQLLRQLNKFKPTSLVVILENKGYKECAKQVCNKPINKGSLDVAHANRYIASLTRTRKNVLILEDDVEFSDELLRDPRHVSRMGQFILANPNFGAYSLGSVNILMMYNPFSSHQKLWLKGGVHAVIYNKQNRDTFENSACDNTLESNDIDAYTQVTAGNSPWSYYRVLAGQVFTATENSKNWGMGLNLFQPVAYWFTRDDAVGGMENMNMVFFIINMIIYAAGAKLILRIYKTARK